MYNYCAIGEWISGATCMYVADYLAKQFSENDEVVCQECVITAKHVFLI